MTIPFLLGGSWVERTESFAVHDPDDGSLVDDVAAASADDAAEAIDYALDARCRPLPAHRRREILSAVAARLVDEAEASAELIAREGIKTIREARTEALRASHTIGLCAEEVGRPRGATLGLDRTAPGEHRFGMSVDQPIGLVVGVTPFNDPLNLVAHKIGPAVAAGNPIIIKPDSKTPLSSLRLARMFTDAGLPAGWLQVLPGRGAELGPALVSHRQVAMVSVTGGVETGRTIAREVGLSRVVMELGANNAAIVEPDADLSIAIPRLASGMYWAAGQNCLHVQRVYGHAEVFDELVGGLVNAARAIDIGPKLDPATDMGPLIDSGAQTRVAGLVEDAIGRGAEAVAGGSTIGRGFEPTVLANVGAGSRILTEEVYGPVTVVAPYRERSEAIAAANATPYGLAGAVFTRSLEAAFEVASQLDVGGVMVNDSTDYRDDAMPFGGGGDSGVGREGVRAAVAAMTEPKTITFTDVARPGLG